MARSRKTAGGMGPYLPPPLSGGNLLGTPQKGFPSPVGKSRSIQMMGNYFGQRAAGMTKDLQGPEQQFRHAFGHYGKRKESELDGL